MSKHPPVQNSESYKKRKKTPKTFSVNQNITINELREKFPNLYSELTEKKMSLGIDEIKEDLITSTLRDGEKREVDPFSNYEPNIFDYLCRAKTEDEGLEIIKFLEKQNQLSQKSADELRKTLLQDGIRSFGSFRSTGYYFRKAAEIKSKKTIRKRYSSPK
ncbi:MAG: DUF2095 family protein [Candidatus Hodarchaeota archaeon]